MQIIAIQLTKKSTIILLEVVSFCILAAVFNGSLFVNYQIMFLNYMMIKKFYIILFFIQTQ